MERLLPLVAALPLISALLVHALAGGLGRRVARLSIGFSLTGFAASSVLLALAIAGQAPRTLTFGAAWGSLLFDPLSVLMATVVSGISLIVHIYSQRYMVEERGFARFYVLLDLMTAALLVMVSAADMITLLIAWHLIGMLLYFLLGQDTRSQTAYRYAFWTLFTYRFGDLPMLLAAGLLYTAFGTWSLPEIFSALAAQPDIRTWFDLPLAEVVAGLIALSAFARSAQFLMHTWLPYTMGGPTPVSALMHAGIVNAGGFLINRFAPVFVHTSDVLHWVFLIGLITAVMGSVLMLAQHDIKKALGYSTMGQMGFMIMECGVGAFSLAVYHLIAHGVFKGTLFLGAGGVIGDARKDDGVPKDDLYTFVVERRPERQRRPWLLMAAITLLVPGAILFAAHYLVEAEFFHKQGAVVLLFFGWITGAQLIFATYRMRTENLARLFTLILTSFTVVVVGYTVISHGFDLFLYPDPVFRAGISTAADIDLIWFDVLVAVVTAFIVLGWLFTYYAEQQRIRDRAWFQALRRRFYRVISREFFINDLYGGAGRLIEAGASRLNVLLRWS
ncbi:MAG: NADH-quinone oxidoreductase subunit L [Gammaproteobacteria bacterium]|nr:NADH-quinone oxidoreductase subunit L [Gammaproteobacteria bacterium]MCP5135205.1 NADH-quinone oxidoreductase subunit L [Gammaproteobacteria bacterium]